MGGCGSTQAPAKNARDTPERSQRTTTRRDPTPAPCTHGLFDEEEQSFTAGGAALSRSNTMKAREADKSVYVLRPTDKIDKYYKMGKQIGQPGQFGVAKIATNLENQQKYVIKIIKKARFQKARPAKRKKLFMDMRDEIAILKKLQHPLILNLYDVFEDKLNLYLVTELCSGGELFDAISQKPKGTYTEKDAAGVLQQIFQAIAHLHDKGIAHCDLKPDNFLFKDRAQKQLKVIDFGMAKRVSRRDKLTKLVGTPYYTAPEVIDHKYHVGADVWSIGVVMFVMLFGYPPFYVDPEEYQGKKEAKAIYKLIVKGFNPIVREGYGPWFPKNIRVSKNAKDLIAKCLNSDLTKRLTALEALDHPWFNNASKNRLEHFNMGIPELHIKSFHNFRTRNEFQQVAYAVFAEKFSVMGPDQKKSVQATFKKLDVDGDGRVDRNEFVTQMSKTELFQGESYKQLQELFANLDIDGDGHLNLKELMTSVVGNMVAARQERLWEQFQKFDTSSDGFISREELEQALQGLEPGLLGNNSVESLIETADADRDGQISWEEFLEALDPTGNDLGLSEDNVSKGHQEGQQVKTE